MVFAWPEPPSATPAEPSAGRTERHRTGVDPSQIGRQFPSLAPTPHVNPMGRASIAGCSRRHIDGATVALAIYAVICCTVTVCLALGLYESMQPRRFANPGLAAYKPPPGTIINLVGLAPPAPRPEIITASIEPPVDPPAQALEISVLPPQVEPKSTNAKPERPKRPRAAHVKRRPDPMMGHALMGYAFQPSFGRSWSW